MFCFFPQPVCKQQHSSVDHISWGYYAITNQTICRSVWESGPTIDWRHTYLLRNTVWTKEQSAPGLSWHTPVTTRIKICTNHYYSSIFFTDTNGETKNKCYLIVLVNDNVIFKTVKTLSVVEPAAVVLCFYKSAFLCLYPGPKGLLSARKTQPDGALRSIITLK